MLDDAVPAKPEDQGVAGGRNKRSNTLEISIGRELRALRKKHDMTVAELGALAKVSSGMLSKIENGLTSPSLATLQALSSALNVSVTAFFRSFEKRRDATFVAAGEGLKIQRRGSRAGHEYQLVVSHDWLSAESVPLAANSRKTFKVVAADHAQPAPSSWTFIAPTSETVEPFRCEFGETMDWALLNSELRIETKSGKLINGNIVIEANESVWNFVPRQPWSAGDYRLSIGQVIEDLAGNSVEKPFEVDLREERPSTGKTQPPHVFRKFLVK